MTIIIIERRFHMLFHQNINKMFVKRLNIKYKLMANGNLNNYEIFSFFFFFRIVEKDTFERHIRFAFLLNNCIQFEE